MLGDDVRFDSRVRKQAKSMAERDWDVVVVGRKAADSDESDWMIGSARVETFPVPGPLRTRRFEYRRAFFRAPFGYRPGRLARLKLQLSHARIADLRFRRAVLAVERPPLATIRRARLAAMLILAKIYTRWVTFRIERSRAVRTHRRRMDGLTDRFSTWWWQRTMGDRAWRKLDPSIWDRELALGEHIDDLKPDLIHANDFRNLHLGARAVMRARAQGRTVKLVWDAHEFLPGMKPWNPHPRWHLALCALEREFAPFADAVVTVSEPLADLLVREYGLVDRPDVVLNAPLIRADRPAGRPIKEVRAVCGVANDVPLLVYSGGIAPQRGVSLMVEALPSLPGVHIAFVVSDSTDRDAQNLSRIARELGVAGRVHFAPYVDPEDIVDYLASADIGVIPIHHWQNHEISLITKFFEYSHARLPILVSDVKTMSETVRQTGQGEVFVAEDVDDYLRAAKALLADPERYRRAYDQLGLLEDWTWEKQAEQLDRIYSGLLANSSTAATS